VGIYQTSKMTDPSFVTIDIDSPNIVSSKNNPAQRNPGVEKEPFDMAFFTSTFARTILIIFIIVLVLICAAILIVALTTR
jgi:hypothetical protein